MAIGVATAVAERNRGARERKNKLCIKIKIFKFAKKIVYRLENCTYNMNITKD